MSKVNTYFENNIGRNILALQILVYYTNIAAILTILVICLNLLVVVLNTISVIILITCDVMRMKI